MLRVAGGLADVQIRNAGDRDNIPQLGGGSLHPLEALKLVKLADLGVFVALFATTANSHGLAGLNAAPLHPANTDAAHIAVVVDVGEQHLGGSLQVALGRGDLPQNHLKQRLHIRAGNIGVQAGAALPGGAVGHGKFQLVVVGPQLDEQIQHLVHHLGGPGAGPVDFVEHHQGLFAQAQGLFQHKAGLGHAALKGVHQQNDRVHHHQHPLHLAAEVRVAGSVHNVYFRVLIFHRRVFGEYGDAPLPLQVAGVHHPFRHSLVFPEDAALF